MARGVVSGSLLACLLCLVPSAHAASSCPNTEVRAQQGVGDLPDCRGYEQVTPADKTGNTPSGWFMSSPRYGRASSGGDKVIYGVSGPLGETSRGHQQFAASQRTSTGWTTRNVVDGPDPSVAVTTLASNLNSPFLAADASRVMFSSAGTFGPPNPYVPGVGTPVSAAVYLTDPLGRLTWLSEPVIPDPDATPGELTPDMFQDMQALGGSPDLSTSYFTYTGTLVAADAPRKGTRSPGLYVYKDGVLASAGILPGGATAGSGGARLAAAESYGSTGAAGIRHSISADGSRLYFVSPAVYDAGAPPQLYLRASNGAVTRLTTVEGTSTAAPHGVIPIGSSNQFAIASASGQSAVFASVDKLTADAPPEDGTTRIYSFDARTGRLTYMPAVSGDVLEVSDDGSTILTMSRPSGPDGDGLYAVDLTIVRNGVPSSIGTFSVSDNRPELVFDNVRLASDGSWVVFVSTGAFGDVNQHPGQRQVYRYEIGDAQPACLSCAAAGQPNRGSDVVLSPINSVSGSIAGTPKVEARGASEDGARVVFETAEALVPRDANGKRDIYRWQVSGDGGAGSVALVSTGASDRDSFLIDTSTTLDSVFFVTSEGLVRGDTDAAYDVYDARVDGGFLETSSGQTACTGDGCQASAAPPPVLPVLGTVTFSGNGNVPPAPNPMEASVRISKLKPVTGSAATLKVRVPGAGRISVSGSSVRTAGRAASKGGTYSVTLTLTSKAKASLKRKKTLKVNARVSFRAQDGQTAARTVSVTFKQAKPKRTTAKNQDSNHA
jgi:hypothetical protein